jgi:hypothetical protein
MTDQELSYHEVKAHTHTHTHTREIFHVCVTPRPRKMCVCQEKMQGPAVNFAEWMLMPPSDLGFGQGLCWWEVQLNRLVLPPPSRWVIPHRIARVLTGNGAASFFPHDMQ